ncbi:MAG: hypothetical protein KTR24_09630 [Saprospiraceae bacterium]|nr:hypothetical protein [Saprospiraceae bacterium]
MKTQNESTGWVTRSLLFFFAVSFLACETHVFFGDSMPPGVADLSRIPMQYVGVYESSTSGAMVHIEDSLIHRRLIDHLGRNIAKMFTEVHCDNDSEDLFLSGRTCYAHAWDSTEIDPAIRDTLFSLCSGGIVKSHSQKLFLNYQDGYGTYLVAVVSFINDDLLVWSLFDLPEDENRLRRMSNDLQVLTNRCNHDVFVLDPKLAEFERLLTSQYLIGQDSLFKIHGTL